MKNIILSKKFGTCERFKILPLFWVEIRTNFQIGKIQWCLGYKVLKIGFLSIYYHSPI